MFAYRRMRNSAPVGRYITAFHFFAFFVAKISSADFVRDPEAFLANAIRYSHFEQSVTSLVTLATLPPFITSRTSRTLREVSFAAEDCREPGLSKVFSSPRGTLFCSRVRPQDFQSHGAFTQRVDGAADLQVLKVSFHLGKEQVLVVGSVYRERFNPGQIEMVSLKDV